MFTTWMIFYQSITRLVWYVWRDSAEVERALLIRSSLETRVQTFTFTGRNNVLSFTGRITPFTGSNGGQVRNKSHNLLQRVTSDLVY